MALPDKNTVKAVQDEMQGQGVISPAPAVKVANMPTSSLLGQAVQDVLGQGLLNYADAQRIYSAQRAAVPQSMTVQESSRTPTPQFGAILQNLEQLKAKEAADLGGRTGSLNSKMYLDTQTNQTVNGVYSRAVGNWVNPATKEPLLPPRYVPTTAGMQSIGIATETQFGKLKKELDENEITLKKYSDYAKNVGSAGVGLERLADGMTSHLKTLFSSSAKQLNLSEKEIALRLAGGQLQGLIGRSRLEIVGGGVMTEQDALRIIRALGGDVDALQNPEIVKRTMQNIFADKYKIYQGDLERYNRNVYARYGQLGYEVREAIDIPDVFSTDTTATVGNLSAQGTGSGVNLITTEMMNAANVKNGSK
tara:strand:+ start:2153 stop:3244 length:1092 start_codon:yes stop_codon:yes gene_type:complete